MQTGCRRIRTCVSGRLRAATVPTVNTPDAALERLREAAATGALDRFCQDRGIGLLVVFGSVVADERVEPPGDLDVAVRFDPPPGDLIAAVNDLIDLTGFSEVDVMDLGRAGVVARAQALGPESLPLFESRAGGFALAQMGALTEAMETAPLRRLDLELLAGR